MALALAFRFTHPDLAGDFPCDDCSNFNSQIDVGYKGKVYHFCCGACEMNFPKLDGVEIVDVTEPPQVKAKGRDGISQTMRGVLAALERRPEPIRSHHNGQPIPGLAWGTFEALKRRGLCEWDMDAVRITDAGRAALATRGSARAPHVAASRMVR